MNLKKREKDSQAKLGSDRLYSLKGLIGNLMFK